MKESLTTVVKTKDLIPLGFVGDADIAVIQSGIDEELTTEISNTCTQFHVFRCPCKSSIK